jgi:hypothetical protein
MCVFNQSYDASNLTPGVIFHGKEALVAKPLEPLQSLFAELHEAQVMVWLIDGILCVE